MSKRNCKAAWKNVEAKLARQDLILQLRYHSLQPSPDSPVFASYKQIGELLKLSHNHIRTICTKVVAGKRSIGRSQDQRKQLDSGHIAYLTSQITLQLQVGRSLDERASLFMNKFPAKDLTGGRLWNIYRKHGIRFKVIKAKKVCPPHRIHEIPGQARNA